MRTLFLVAILFVAVSLAAFPTKKLAGPPSEFSTHRMPNPGQNPLLQRSVTEYVWLKKQDGSPEFAATLSIPVDGPGEFVWTLASPYAEYLKIVLKDPQGAIVDLTNALIEGVFPIGYKNTLPISTYEIKDSMVGFYTLEISTQELATEMTIELTNQQEGFPHVLVTLVNNDNLQLQSHLQSYDISVGKTVAVRAQMVDSSKIRFDNSYPPVDLDSLSVSDAVLDFLTPDGHEASVPMNDAGIGMDVMAGDGIFTGHLRLDKPGQYVAQPTMRGSFSKDPTLTISTPFVRSTQHLIAVSKAEVKIVGTASASQKAATNRLFINLPIDVTALPDTIRAYTEVYATEIETGKQVAVAWLGGIVDVVRGVISLELDENWLKMAGAALQDLVLKNTYLADVDTSFIVASFLEDIKVALSGEVQTVFHNARLATDLPTEITYEMRNGVNPLASRKRAGSKSALVTIPGYCAGGSPWAPNANDFTDAYHFQSESLNVSNDVYAKKVLAYVESLRLDSFGLLGHSQGGVVALHIHNYYFSGLEAASGGKLIQSVGTPYQGCTAAGSAADLGNSFGVGCGSNSDLSRDGAVVWLAGISQDSRKDVYYYTTTYKQGNFFGDYCSAPMNTILQWPNDGTTELKYAPLEGGHNMGNTQKQCHTTGMSYDAQYNDHARNKKISAEAAR